MDVDRTKYEVLPGAHGGRVRLFARGREVIRIPRVNRGAAFTLEQREALGLKGQLPTGVTPLELQLSRVYEQFRARRTNFDKFIHLSALRERNTVLFYRLLSEHLAEMMPIVYTPTIGEAIELFSHFYNRLHAVFLSIDDGDADTIEESLRSSGRDADEVDAIIVTDSEGILGIGDQGVGGVLITIGKKSLYTAAGGLDPDRMVPVMLDVGTDNLGLLNDDFYLGLRHARVRGEQYDEFIERFVEAANKVFPHAMIHWEDFGAANAHRILDKYRDNICTFNDDVQGTAAVVAAAVLSAVKATGERLRDQRVVIHGAGTAGVGIADLLIDLMVAEGATREEARAQFWCTGSRGLISTALGDLVRDFQRPYARDAAELANWKITNPRRTDLGDIVRNVHPTILIGTSAQHGSFTEEIIRDMASHVDRPIIMPLSNPTPKAEAVPAALIAWTDGAALIATGSPFGPVDYEGVTYDIAQANNAFVFPGIGLGVAVCRARRVTDGMIAAAAQAVASLPQVSQRGASLLPAVNDLRRVSAVVAIAVAQAASEEGVAEIELDNPVQQVFEAMWQPAYPELVIDDEGTTI